MNYGESLIAFLGYVLPFGQMSLWGGLIFAPNVYLIISNYIPLEECLDILYHVCSVINICIQTINIKDQNLISYNHYLHYPSVTCLPIAFAFATSFIAEARESSPFGGEVRVDNCEKGEIGAKANTVGKDQEIKIQKIRANLRIGTHNKDILSILFGSLLGDAHAEFRLKGNGTRINFYQEGSHVSYLIWLHKMISELGYCNTNLPKITTRLGKKGVVRKIIRFNTWTYSSFNWIHELFYKDGKNKGVPSNIAEYLTPLALAIWIMDDGGKLGQGLKLSTNSFSFSDCNFLVKVLYENFKLKASVQSAGVENKYIIYIWKDSMPLLREIVLPYVHPSMKYKLINK